MGYPHAMSKITNLALIVAAGRGARANLSKTEKRGLPKVYRALPHGGKTSVLETVVARFLAHEQIDAVLVVVHSDDVELYNSAIKNLKNNDKLLPHAIGGATRQHSVWQGLEAAAPHKPAHVLVHDAARPYVSEALIARCITGLGSAVAAIPAIPPRDSVKNAENGVITASLPRDSVWLAQTPQAFHFGVLCAAYQQLPEAVLAQMSDDAAIAEMVGIQPALIAGEESNIKLTFAEDFEGAPANLLPRTGSGYDVHALGDVGSATHIMLGGVSIPHNRALIGHSDADVALHALTDALLGALVASDIGAHFPPSDTEHKDRPSCEFLTAAVAIAAAQNAQICHADITLICEQPKIAPYRDAMRERIGALLHLPVSAVSVKATTTEGLGAIGRGEGIAAQATLTLMMPFDE